MWHQNLCESLPFLNHKFHIAVGISLPLSPSPRSIATTPTKMPHFNFSSFFSSSVSAPIKHLPLHAPEQTVNFMPQNAGPTLVMSSARCSPSADADRRERRLLRTNSLSNSKIYQDACDITGLIYAAEYHGEVEDSEDEHSDDETPPPKSETQPWLSFTRALLPDASTIQQRPDLVVLAILSFYFMGIFMFRVNFVLNPGSYALRLVISIIGWLTGKLCAWFVKDFRRRYHV